MSCSDRLPPLLSATTDDMHQRAELSEILVLAEHMTGDRDQAIDLVLHRPIPVFDGQTAVALILQGRGRAVLRYLENLSAGATG